MMNLLKKLFKKNLLPVFVIYFMCFYNGFAKVRCYYLKYNVKISKSNEVSFKEIFVSNNFVKIKNTTNKFVLFDLNKNFAYEVNVKEKQIYKREFKQNEPFFIKFIVNYGIISNDDKLIFPKVIFRKTGKVENINNIDCYQVKLPGSFLNSVTYLWFSKESSEEKGKIFAKYLSSFSKNSNLLQSAKDIGGFPIKTLTLFNLNTKKFSKETVLSLNKFIIVDDMFFTLPQNCKIIKTAD